MTGIPRRLKHSPSRPSDVVFVRQSVRVWAIGMKLSLIDQTKIVTAASELARNTLEHGGGGELEIAEVSNGIRKGLRLTFSDKGPGIFRCEAGAHRRLYLQTGDGVGAGWEQAPGERI